MPRSTTAPAFRSSPSVPIAGLVVATMLATMLWGLGISAFPLIFVAVAAGAAALAQVSNYPTGVLGAWAIAAAGLATIIHFSHWLPGGLPLVGAAGLLLLIIGALAWISRYPQPVWPSARSLAASAGVCALSLLATVVWIPWRSHRGQGPVWAMHNDMAFGMVEAREMITAGGLDLTKSLNPSPLDEAMMALVASVGRLRVADPNLNLGNDVVRSAELWGLLIISTMLLSAWITWRMISLATITAQPGTEPGSRRRLVKLSNAQPALVAIAVTLAFLLPGTWYFTSFALGWGFPNSTIALVLLLVAWALFLELDRVSPLLITTLLSITTVATLAVWPPLALIPAALSLLAWWRAWNSESPRNYLKLALSLLPILLYGVIITIPDFLRENEALANPGGIVTIRIRHVLLVIALTILASFVYSRFSRINFVLPGTLAVIIAGGIAVLFLGLMQLRGGAPWWSYYPIKAAWGVTTFLIIVGAGMALGVLLNRPVPSFDKVTSIILAVMVSIGVMRQYTWSGMSFFAITDIVNSTAFARYPERANQTFAAYRENQLSVLSLTNATWNQWSPENIGQTDSFANFWLLQLSVEAGLPNSWPRHFRENAYMLDPQSATDLCKVITQWSERAGSPAEFITDDAELAIDITETCAANFIVSLP